MTRLNWEKVNKEKKIQRSLSDLTPKRIKRRKKAKRKKLRKASRPEVPGISLVSCLQCKALVNRKKLNKHITKVHGATTPIDNIKPSDTQKKSTTCTICGRTVPNDRLKVHTIMGHRERYGSTTLMPKLLSEPRMHNVCRHCGNPAIPGSDICYSCSG